MVTKVSATTWIGTPLISGKAVAAIANEPRPTRVPRIPIIPWPLSGTGLPLDSAYALAVLGRGLVSAAENAASDPILSPLLWAVTAREMFDEYGR